MKKIIHFLAAVILLWHITPAFGFAPRPQVPASNKAEELRRLDHNFRNRNTSYMRTSWQVHEGYAQAKIPERWHIPIDIFLKKDFDSSLADARKGRMKGIFEEQQSQVAQGAFVDMLDRRDEFDEYYEANLCTAVREADIPYVKLLLEHGARSLERGKKATYSHYTTFKTRNAEIFKLLIQYGVITPEHFETMEAEDRAFIEPIYNALKSEYIESARAVRKQYAVTKLSLMPANIPNDVSENIFEFVANKPLNFTFEQRARVTGALAVMRQLIKRMNFLGIHVIEDPLSRDPKNPRYKVIDENDVATPTSAQQAEHGEDVERTTSSTSSLSTAMGGRSSASSTFTDASENDMKDDSSE